MIFLLLMISAVLRNRNPIANFCENFEIRHKPENGEYGYRVITIVRHRSIIIVRQQSFKPIDECEKELMKNRTSESGNLEI